MRKERGFPFRVAVNSGEGRLIPALFEEGWMSFVGVLNGRVTIRSGVFSAEGEAGELFFVPSSSFLLCDSAGGFASVRLMTFHSSILTGNMDALEQDLLYMLTVQARNSLFRFGPGHPLHAKLAASMQTAAEEYLAKELCHQLPIRANIYLMMTALLRYYSTEKKEDEHAVYHNVLRMRSVLDRIDSGSAERIAVPELAEMLTLTPDHFTRIFRESVGSTPVEYINRVRLCRAMVLLCSGNGAMAEVAAGAGFTSVQHFFKLFRSVIGNSPAAFRRFAQQ